MKTISVMSVLVSWKMFALLERGEVGCVSECFQAMHSTRKMLGADYLHVKSDYW